MSPAASKDPTATNTMGAVRSARSRRAETVPQTKIAAVTMRITVTVTTITSCCALASGTGH